jgi:type IV pilus assembly protein PilP
MTIIDFPAFISRIAVVGACFILVGCARDDMSDLEAYVAEVRGRAKGTIETLPELRIVEPFVFRPNQVRDPFEPDESLQEQKDVRVETGIRPDTLRPREELEGFELDSLRMVGTVRQQGVIWALVETKEGTVHRVRVGNYIGKNYGKIVNIVDNQIELVEIVADSAGAWRERKAAVTMGDKENKAP